MPVIITDHEKAERFEQLNNDEYAKNKLNWGWETQPKQIPATYQHENTPPMYGEGTNTYWVRRRRDRMLVGISWSIELDGKRWLHVSFSHRDKIPSYADLCEVKEIFVGKDRQAITVHPPKKAHVSYDDFCLHLWCCLDGDGLPDFRRGTNLI